MTLVKLAGKPLPGGEEVLDKGGAGRGAVTPPQAIPDGVAGCKEQRPVDVRQVAGARAFAAGVDVGDQSGGGRRPIALP